MIRLVSLLPVTPPWLASFFFFLCCWSLPWLPINRQHNEACDCWPLEQRDGSGVADDCGKKSASEVTYTGPFTCRPTLMSYPLTWPMWANKREIWLIQHYSRDGTCRYPYSVFSYRYKGREHLPEQGKQRGKEERRKEQNVHILYLCSYCDTKHHYRSSNWSESYYSREGTCSSVHKSRWHSKGVLKGRSRL